MFMTICTVWESLRTQKLLNPNPDNPGNTHGSLFTSKCPGLFCNVLTWSIRKVYSKPQVLHVGQVKNIFTWKTVRIQNWV